MSDQSVPAVTTQKNGLIGIGVAFALLTVLTAGIATAVVVSEINAAPAEMTIAQAPDRSGIR